MAIKSDKLGPGRLTFGEVASPTEFGSQVTKVELTPSSDEGEVVTVLSGEELVDGNADSYTLSGEFFQDYSDMTSLLVWCKTNRGVTMPFEYVPNTTGKLGVRGTCRIAAVMVGGDVKARNKTEFSFAGVGDFTFFDHTAP